MVAVGDDHIGDSIMTQTNGGIGVSGSIAITGSITASGTSLVSGSSQISYSGLNGVPSGIISGSSQLPSGLVSGSVQIDVMSTTNIARLATTGSNNFIGNQSTTGTISATSQITSTAFLAATRAGANGVGEGPYVVISQPSESKQWLYQLNGVAGLDFWHYNGSSWSIPFYMTTAGATTITATDGSGARTTPFTAMTLVSDNTSNPYDGFGTALLFRNRIYSGGPTPGGIRDGARIRTSLKNNSTVNLGTDLVFDVTTTGNGALTTALTLSYDNGATFSGNAIFNGNIGVGVSPLTKLHLQGASPNYIVLTNTAADGVQNAIQGGIIGQSRGYSNNLSQMASILFRNENSATWYKGEITFNTNGSDGTNPEISPTERLRITSGGYIGVNDATPTKMLTVNFGTSISDGLLVTGSQRQETRFKSSGEHSNVFIDSGHQNIYLPTLALLRNGSSFGEVKLQRASNSDSIGSFTESEMIIGSTTSVPVSVKTNEVRRIHVASGGNVTVYNSLSVNGNFGARNFNNAIKSWSSNGSYTWSTELSALSGFFDSACWYKGFIRESNGAHYYGYQFDIHVGQIGYGGASSQFIVRNMTYAGGPWTGGCGSSSFAAIDNSGFTKQNSGCFDSLELFITRLG
jgi:hypothetical protein